MYYKGKLYGKSRGRYFEMEETSEDVDRLKERIKDLESLVSKVLESLVLWYWLMESFLTFPTFLT